MTSEQDIKTVAHWLNEAQQIVAFTGAGISTRSGIPDFRSPDSGLWTHADPMSVASIFGFRQNPRGFYDWVRGLAHVILSAQPNPAHLALAELEKRGKLKAVITQNIDMLHTRAGNQIVHELHGHMREATCIQCFQAYNGEDVMNDFLETDVMPTCARCGGVLKPNVILFGEQLPYKPLQASQQAARSCDLMLVIGSSLEVEPASQLPWLAKRCGAKVVLINLQETDFDSAANLVIRDDVAVVLPAILAAMTS